MFVHYKCLQMNRVFEQKWKTLLQNAAEKYLGKAPSGFLVGDVDDLAAFIPQNVVQRMVDQHTEKRPDHDSGVQVTHHTLLLTLPDVITNKLVNAGYKV